MNATGSLHPSSFVIVLNSFSLGAQRKVCSGRILFRFNRLRRMRSFSAISFVLILFRTLLPLLKSDLLSFQANPSSFCKTPGGGYTRQRSGRQPSSSRRALPPLNSVSNPNLLKCLRTLSVTTGMGYESVWQLTAGGHVFSRAANGVASPRL
jgi:hypothetical protein